MLDAPDPVALELASRRTTSTLTGMRAIRRRSEPLEHAEHPSQNFPLHIRWASDETQVLAGINATLLVMTAFDRLDPIWATSYTFDA